MWKTAEGSTGRLIQLCIGYFLFYIITGVTVKYFLGSGMNQMEVLAYSTLGGNFVAISVVVALRWYRLESSRLITWGKVTFPSEFVYIIPSGVCTAVVIATTTLMYTLPISVMVAMVIMRGSVILISRVVDAVQIRQGILNKRVYMEENLGVVFALLAVGVHLVDVKGDGHFDFVTDPIAMIILGSYITAYAIRIYIMNYFKNTRGKGVKLDNKGFFAIEQFAACGTLVAVTLFVFYSPSLFGWSVAQIDEFRTAILEPNPRWSWAAIAGMSFGAAAFFSVFIFMFKGRTATFAGLVNRLTSLIAGTAATIIFALGFGGRMPQTKDWMSLGFILVAVAFLTRAERRRAAELAAARALETEASGAEPTGGAGR
jgi:hypothetical protein